MKEAPNMLPPKLVGGILPTSNTTKVTSDEILSTLLRINNFDSISSIKDESLDIDLSACVTISPSGIINGNSLSSSDFWRVLDESAQIPEKEAPNASIKDEVKEELPSSFSGTFLRPDPPASITISPVKKLANTRPNAGEHKKRKLKTVGKPLTTEQPTNGSSSTLSSPPPLYIKKEISDFTFETDTIELNNFKTECQTEDSPKHKLISLPSFSEIHTPKTINSLNITATLSNARQNVLTFSQAVDLSQMIIGHVNLHNININNTSNSITNGHPVANSNLTEPSYQFSQQQQHQKHNQDSRSSYKCTECENEFDQEAALKKHLKTHRTTADGRKDAWKKCPDCGKCLKLGSMWMHRKIHSDNRKYECDVCGQKFVQKINLTHHARIHTSEKPYECPECQKRFQERSHLQRHQKYHAQTRSYRCDKCGKMYKTERCLKVHNLVHLERRPFACTVCDKSFISNSKLKQHLNIHTGARPFKCNYCPRDFTNFPNWLKHTRRRHKVDHKTGEQLENIPSYCSKKSTNASAAVAASSGAITVAAAAVVVAAGATTTSLTAATNATAKIQQQQLQAKTHDANAASNIVPENLKITSKSTTLKTKETVGLIKQPTVRRKKKTTPTSIAAAAAQIPQQVDEKIVADILTTASTQTPSQTTKAIVKLIKTENAIMNAPTTTTATIIGITPMPLSAIVSSTTPTITTTAAAVAPVVSTMITKSTNSIATLANKNNLHNTNNNKNKTTPTLTTTAIVVPKIKRERKQLSPKQVPLELGSTLSPLKAEPNDLERKQLITNFLDLHCLSLTSAEELIMEQALEMEECGLYDAPVSAVFN